MGRVLAPAGVHIQRRSAYIYIAARGSNFHSNVSFDFTQKQMSAAHTLLPFRDMGTVILTKLEGLPSSEAASTRQYASGHQFR